MLSTLNFYRNSKKSELKTFVANLQVAPVSCTWLGSRKAEYAGWRWRRRRLAARNVSNRTVYRFPSLRLFLPF